MSTQKKSLENDNTIHHICSGGFIFYKDKETGEIYTLLIKNKKGEIWISKGHLEEGEDQLQTAFREIEEETTLKKCSVKHVGFCSLIRYSFTKDGSENNKQVYINVFEAMEKNDLTPRPEDIEVTEILWLRYSDALRTIAFNKEELIRSKNIYEKYLDGSN
ncbi:MAG: NUDIX domain-containing protein [Candidatus Berkelbacteria bacterium]